MTDLNRTLVVPEKAYDQIILIRGHLEALAESIFETTDAGRISSLAHLMTEKLETMEGLFDSFQIVKE